MNPLRVLITNNTLDARAGTELYVYDLAVALLERGHQPVAYSNILGQVAGDLREACVPVIDQLDSLSIAPDIIHGHHHLEAMTALMHFPRTPAVLFCHSWRHWEEMPARFPRIRRYLAMNQPTYNRLTCEHGVPPEQVEWMPNFVDLKRFQLRLPLPQRPVRAAVFSNHAREDGYLRIIRAACDRSGLALDVLGLGVGNPVPRPWEVLGKYDLVFASGRCALESLASGTAVIICNTFGLGPMVTAAKVDELRTFNFGSMSTIGRPFDVDQVLIEIAHYSADDAADASRRVRAVAGLDSTVDRLATLYTDVITEQQHARVTADDESRAVAAYLRQISDRVKASGLVRHSLDVARAETAGLNHLLDVSRAETAGLSFLLDVATHENVQLGAAYDTASAELAAAHQTLTMRIRQRLIRVNILMRLHRLVRRSRP